MDGMLAHFAERIEWSDAEQALDTAAASLCGLAADSALLQEAIEQLDVERLDSGWSAGGAYWFILAENEEDDLSVWIRYCPTGCVAPAHGHRWPILALVLAGTFKQTLIGVGGGVDSPDHPIELFVRHERRGQVFALDPLQQHETSSTAGSLILAVMPIAAVSAEAVAIDEQQRSKAEAAIRRLRRAAKEIFGGVPV